MYVSLTPSMKDKIGDTPSESAVRKTTQEVKKRYITLIDRTFKGKEWWSSGHRGYQFIRSLTDEEAKTLDNIELAPEIIKPKPFEKIIDEKEARAGRLSCIKCGSKK